MRFQSLVCAAIMAFCTITNSLAADPANNTHNPFESANTSQSANKSDGAKKSAAPAKKKIATALPKAQRENNKNEQAKKQGTAKKLAEAHKKAIAQKKAREKAKQKAAAEAPFVRNHYVLTGYMPVNGYHKGKPVVVIVDKGSHFTHVLQLQGKRICRVLTISNAIGTYDRPTPPGPYIVTMKKKLPTWIPPRSIDKKQKPVPPYNLTHRNPLGVAAIYLNKFEINLHGTNQQNLIRKSVSHGCVRHSNKDIMKLYNMVDRGDRVYIVNRFRGKVIHRSDFTNPR